jgi:hypothetical protein
MTQVPRGCSVPDCGQPAHLYACGWRCDKHAPGPAITYIQPATGSRQGSTTQATAG